MASIATLSRSNGTTTVTTSLQCGIANSQRILVLGSSNATFHGYFTAINATGITATSFTYSQSFAISAISRTSNVVTVTVTIPSGFDSHQFLTGDSIVITCPSSTSFNGTFTITATGRNTFTYSQVAADATGTVTSATAWPANASATDGTVVAVLKLTPNGISADNGFNIYGTPTAASELAAITDDLDTSYIRASDTSNRSITFNLSNVGTGSAGIQTNQDAGSAQARLRLTATSASSFTAYVTDNAGSGASYLAASITDLTTLNSTPGTPNNAAEFPGSAKPSYYASWPDITLNSMTLKFNEYGTTTAALVRLYEAWLDVHLWSKPYVSVAVSGGSPVTTTRRPTFTWTHNQADGFGQAYYQIKVFASQVADPSTATGALWSASGYSSATSATCAVDLPLGQTLYAYVRTGIAWSAYNPTYTSLWGSGTPSSEVAFTLSQAAPNSPVLTACSWVASRQAVTLTATGYGNLLGLDESSLESTVGQWIAATNMTSVARSTAQAYIGSASLAMTCSATSPAVAATTSGTGAYRCYDGELYKGIAMFRAATTGRTCEVGLQFYDSAGVSLGTTYGTGITDTTTGWTAAMVSVTSPANAYRVRMVLRITGAGASEVHYADQMGISTNSSGTTTRTNLILNPSVETNATYWSTSNGTGATSNAYGWVGAQSYLQTWDGAGAGSGSLSGTGTGSRIAVSASTAYTFSVYAREGSVTRDWQAYIDWYTGGNVYISRSLGGIFSVPVGGGWVRLTATATSPVTAAVATPGWTSLDIPTSGQTLYVDGALLEASGSAGGYFDGASGNARWTGTAHASTSIEGQPWESGGLDTRLFTVQRSLDGQTWENVRTISANAITQSLQRRSGYDYEVPRGVTVMYRTFVDATDESGNTATSNYSPMVTVTTVNDGAWWLKDPLNSGLNMGAIRVQAASVNNTVDEATGVFRVYGRSKAIVTAGAFTGEDGTLEVFASDAEWATLEPLIAAQRTLLLQDPNGDQKYVRIVQRGYQKEWLGGDQTYRVSLGYVEVDAP